MGSLNKKETACFAQNRITVIIILEFPIGGEDRVLVGHRREESGEDRRGRGEGGSKQTHQQAGP